MNVVLLPLAGMSQADSPHLCAERLWNDQNNFVEVELKKRGRMPRLFLCKPGDEGFLLYEYFFFWPLHEEITA